MFAPHTQRWIFRESGAHISATCDDKLTRTYISVNSLRCLTLVACALVFAATCVILKIDFANARGARQDSDGNALPYVSGTVSGTDVPTKAWGQLWSFIHHLSTLLQLSLLILSELPLPGTFTNKGVGGHVQRLLVSILPVLSLNASSGVAGALLISIGADGLSRNIGGRLSLVSNWLLVSVGLVNILSALTFKSKAKRQRSFLNLSKSASVLEAKPNPPFAGTESGDYGKGKSGHDHHSLATSTAVTMPSSPESGLVTGALNRANSERTFVTTPPRAFHRSRSVRDGLPSAVPFDSRSLPSSLRNFRPPPNASHRSSTWRSELAPDSASYYGDGSDAASLPSHIFHGRQLPPHIKCRTPAHSRSRSMRSRASGSDRWDARNSDEFEVGGHTALDSGSGVTVRSISPFSTHSRAASFSDKRSRTPVPIYVPRPSFDNASRMSEAMETLQVVAPMTPSPAERSPGLVAQWRAAALEARIKAQAKAARRSFQLQKRTGEDDGEADRRTKKQMMV